MDKGINTSINGTSFHDNSEGTAYYQDQGADAHRGTGAIACNQTLENIIQETKAAEVFSTPDTGCFVKFLAGVVNRFSILTIEDIIGKAQLVQILLSPGTGVSGEKFIQSGFINAQFLHKSRILRKIR